MAFDSFTLTFASLMVIPGLIFMLKSKQVVSGVSAQEAGITLLPGALALASYYLYLVGMIMFALSMIIVGAASGVPMVLGITAAVSGPISVLLFMSYFRQSITGIPGISGPPMPARILLILIGIVIHANAILHVVDGDVAGLDWAKFGGLYVIAVSIPHLIGLKHRKEQWDAVPIL